MAAEAQNQTRNLGRKVGENANFKAHDFDFILLISAAKEELH
jgi:hypothetical protein